jgi:hypothetical protein
MKEREPGREKKDVNFDMKITWKQKRIEKDSKIDF